jgi:hypothetical protein
VLDPNGDGNGAWFDSLDSARLGGGGSAGPRTLSQRWHVCVYTIINSVIRMQVMRRDESRAATDDELFSGRCGPRCDHVTCSAVWDTGC